MSETGANMYNYPISLIQAYRNKEISKPIFQDWFSCWQKMNGIDLESKAIVVGNRFVFAYRGIRGTVENGKIVWAEEIFDTIQEFQRAVDASFCRVAI